MKCFAKQTLLSIDLLEAKYFLESAWNSVTFTALKNNFRHGGFQKEDIEQTYEREMVDVIEKAEKRGIISPCHLRIIYELM